MVKRLVHLALLVGAILGLLGQGAAVASAFPCPEMAGFGVAQDAADCHMMAAAADTKSIPASKHMPPCCAGMIGCVTPVTMDPAPLISASLPIEPIAATWPPAQRLFDRSIAPEQEPPASLL